MVAERRGRSSQRSLLAAASLRTCWTEAAALAFLGVVLTVIAFVAWYAGVRGLIDFNE